MDHVLERVTRQVVADATGGRVMAQVNKAKHEVADVGEVRIDEGTAFNMPPNIKHSFLAGSDDFDTLEIFMPVDFGTVVDEE